MKLMTKEQRIKLLQNGMDAREGTDLSDREPVVKLFNPCGAATWLLIELDPDNHDTAFGLCDLGMGFPELGYVSLSELESVRLPFGLKIERDIHFDPRGRTLAEYTEEASKRRSLVAETAAEYDDSHPDDAGISNEERAGRIDPALAAYVDARDCGEGVHDPLNPDQSNISDLIADLMHYCHRHRLDYWRLSHIAQRNFTAEYKAQNPDGDQS